MRALPTTVHHDRGAALNVVKRSGGVEPFRRDKIVSGVRKACQGRPVTDDELAVLAQQVEDSLRDSGCAEVRPRDRTDDPGTVAGADEVAHLRFASVYRSSDSLADFEHEIALPKPVVSIRGRRR